MHFSSTLLQSLQFSEVIDDVGGELRKNARAHVTVTPQCFLFHRSRLGKTTPDIYYSW